MLKFIENILVEIEKGLPETWEILSKEIGEHMFIKKYQVYKCTVICTLWVNKELKCWTKNGG